MRWKTMQGYCGINRLMTAEVMADMGGGIPISTSAAAGSASCSMSLTPALAPARYGISVIMTYTALVAACVSYL